MPSAATTAYRSIDLNTMATTISAETKTAVPSTSDHGRNAVLVRLLQITGAGDQEAFRRLHLLVRAPLLRFAFKACGNAQDAEEIVQEAFISIWRNARSYDVARAAPMTWMCTIVRHQACDVYRRASAGTRESAWMGVATSAEQTVPSAYDLMEIEEEIGALLTRLNMLSAAQRSAVELTCLRGLTHTEAAHELNKPLGTVKTLVRRGLLSLRAPASFPVKRYSQSA